MITTMEQFTKERFDTVMRNAAAYFGLTLDEDLPDSEYIYRLRIDDEVYIKVRSSISPITGLSDKSGKDSIRLYLMNGYQVIGRYDTFTQRVPGWESRIMDKIGGLLHYYQESGRCKKCNGILQIYKVVDKSKPTYGNHFARCPAQKTKGDGHAWKWLK